jgi:maltooligosyltrehalose trehalohydrolase
MTEATDVERLGASVLPGNRCRFVVWAPEAQTVSVRRPGGDDELLTADGDGYHRGVLEQCPAGTVYRYVLDGGQAYADPASRSQPSGVHGPSAVFDPDTHAWGDADFVAPAWWTQVIYELHVGTFTASGTLDEALEAMDCLVDLGVTTIELMPLAQFPGRRNWGYDGVFLFAVQDSYGGPAALQRFVDGCHRRGLAVMLDVVYNHVGPEGNILGSYGPYFTDRYVTPWGSAMNVDGPGSDEVRRFFIENALGWFRDFHIDGLRLDAIHSIVDPTARPFIGELAAATADLGIALGRSCLLVGESADNNPAVVASPSVGGLGLDAQWNDDFHHALHAAVTGENAGYYADFGRLDQLARALSDGFVYQGQYSEFRGRRHGSSSVGLPPERFVVFAQNHDQIGNRPGGDRLSTVIGFDARCLVAAVLLLAPGVPLLFMGEEYGETAPFPYFVDHGDPALIAAVRQGRAVEFGGWSHEALDPAAEETFLAAKIDVTQERDGSQGRLLELCRALIALRRTEPALHRSAPADVSADAHGDVLTLTRRTEGSTVIALFNVSDRHTSVSVPEPPVGGKWQRLIASVEPRFGGSGDDDISDGLLGLPRYGFEILGCRVGQGTRATPGRRP